jgi:hypothetical protein
MAPVNVPRELTGVKHKAHNRLWISIIKPTLSRPSCIPSTQFSVRINLDEVAGESLES